jgi:uncharacterized protein (DUF2147 family)
MISRATRPLALLALIAFSISASAASELTGVWRSIDDNTGNPKSIIRIDRTTDGNYAGTVVKVLAEPGEKPEVTCHDCPAPFTGKPIEGMNILWGLKADQTDHDLYAGGKVLDPLSGHTYSAKITLDPSGKKLVLRGFLGFSLLGRSQVWYREQ